MPSAAVILNETEMHGVSVMRSIYGLDKTGLSVSIAFLYHGLSGAYQPSGRLVTLFDV